ncbi:MAG TPA: Ig-like domain-containing protein [Vicinamibacterales bacterium]|nr:Ig-like domain-containing protein [Vicinamibacterales bacterium]
MISRSRLAALVLVPTVAFVIEVACSRVPLLAPSGSSITLTTATAVLPLNGSATVIAQVVESAGTAPQAGTHVTFTTSLGTIQPSDATTDSSGRATATFSSSSSGTATITAISGGATTGSSGALKILVGAAAVQKIVVGATPATVPALGGSTTIAATVFDVNGNLITGIPVTFTTTAGTLSASIVNTDVNGNASTTLTTAQAATVTASVGVGNSTSTTPPSTTPPATGTPSTGTPTTGTPSASGQASASVTVSIAAAPTIVITPPTTAPSAGLPASFTIAVTVPATGSAIKDVSVDWGDNSATDLGAVTGNAVVSHVYTNAGTFVVKASATDATGNTTSVSSIVTVIVATSPTVIVTPTVVPTVHAAQMPVTFQVQVTPPTGVGVVSVTMNFGDGVTSSLGGLTGTTTVQHTYTAAGSFPVTVSVTDTLGRTTLGQTAVTLP